MKKIKNVFDQYRWKIMSNAFYVKTLITGSLPLIHGFEEIEEIIIFYNKARKDRDWFNFFDRKTFDNDEYFLYNILFYFINPLIEIKKNLSLETKKYHRNYKYFQSKINQTKQELKKLYKNDYEINEKKVSSNRMHDLSTGIFEYDEVAGREFFNRYVKVYKSKETENMEINLEDLYDRFFSYFYIKLEYVSSLALKIYPIKNKKWLSWIDKLNAINKMPLGKSIDKKEYRIIMRLSNHYKHQTVFKEKFPSINFLNSFINKIINKIKKILI